MADILHVIVVAVVTENSAGSSCTGRLAMDAERPFCDRTVNIAAGAGGERSGLPVCGGVRLPSLYLVRSGGYHRCIQHTLFWDRLRCLRHLQ